MSTIRNRNATPATLPTTPPTILFVVGLGVESGGRELVAVELGPLAVDDVPKPPAVGKPPKKLEESESVANEL